MDKLYVCNRWAPRCQAGYLICLLLIICRASAYAQMPAGDSTEATSLFDYRNARVEFFTGTSTGLWQETDTTLNGFYQFQGARKQYMFEPVITGNLGSPYAARFFDYGRMIGFDYGRHERDAYITDVDDVRFWRTNVPFTNVGYVAGQFAEQYFYVTHTRNFGPQANIAIDFNKLVSEGYYQRSRNDYGNTAISGWYQTKNERYAIYLAGVRGVSEHMENGGINNDTLFDYPNPELAEPFRAQAFSSWDNWQCSITQVYRFGDQVAYQVNDSTQDFYFAPKAELRYIFKARDQFYQFEDPESDQSFYGQLYFEQDTLRDRTQVRGFTHLLMLENPEQRKVAADSLMPSDHRWRISAMYQWHDVSDLAGVRNFQNMILGGFYKTPQLLGNRMYLLFTGNYDVQETAYSSRVKVEFPNNTLKPSLAFRTASLAPTVMDERYIGFDRFWDLEGRNTKLNSAELILRPKGFELHVLFTSLSNYYFTVNTYAFDPGEESQVVPTTVDKVNVSQVWITRTFTPGVFVLENAIGVQGSDADLNMPSAMANVNWYYKGSVFKKALHTHIGMHAWYCSSYRALPYDMITGRFLNVYTGYFGTPLSEEVITEPVIDIYASFDVRTLRFFVKMENIAQGLFSKGWYQAPNYPMQPRAFKLGIDWNLYY